MRVGKGQACLIAYMDGEEPTWTHMMQAALVPSTPHIDTAGNPKGCVGIMNAHACNPRLRIAAVLCFLGILAAPVMPGVRNWAVVASAGSKLQDVSLTDLAKLCKGSQKAWADGKNFTLVMTDPEAPELRVAVQKLFGVGPSEVKAVIARLNEGRPIIKIVESGADLLRTVEETSGAIGIVDVYSITSAVKVLRIDGKLPFDVGYALKGN